MKGGGGESHHCDLQRSHLRRKLQPWHCNLLLNDQNGNTEALFISQLHQITDTQAVLSAEQETWNRDWITLYMEGVAVASEKNTWFYLTDGLRPADNMIHYCVSLCSTCVPAVTRSNNRIHLGRNYINLIKIYSERVGTCKAQGGQSLQRVVKYGGSDGQNTFQKTWHFRKHFKKNTTFQKTRHFVKTQHYAKHTAFHKKTFEVMEKVGQTFSLQVPGNS